MFQGSSTQLYVPAFTQKDFHYSVHTGLPTQGSSTEDLGKYNLRVHNSSLNQIQPLTRGKVQSQHNFNLSLEGYQQTQSPLHLEGNHNLMHNLLYTQKARHEATSKWMKITLSVSTNYKPIFSQHKDPIDRIDMIAQV